MKRTHEQELHDFLENGIAPENPKLFLKRLQSTQSASESVPEDQPLVDENDKLVNKPKDTEQKNPKAEPKSGKRKVAPLKVETAGDGGTTDKADEK